ncbi:MAG: YraN family protein [Bryobacteraceae bacterium]
MTGWIFRILDRLRDAARRRRWNAGHSAGRTGEDLAHRRLRDLGFVIVSRNFRRRSGSAELDLVAWEGETLVFVEVKTRGTGEFGAPDRAVDAEKQIHIAKAAREYIRRSRLAPAKVRFDIVSIVLTCPPSVELLRDAFRPPAWLSYNTRLFC